MKFFKWWLSYRDGSFFKTTLGMAVGCVAGNLIQSDTQGVVFGVTWTLMTVLFWRVEAHQKARMAAMCQGLMGIVNAIKVENNVLPPDGTTDVLGGEPAREAV